MGLMGRLTLDRNFPFVPIFPILPIVPIVPIFSTPTTSISEINFLLEVCRVLHSAKIPTMGCTRSTAHSGF